MTAPRRPDAVRQVIRAVARSATEAGCTVTLDHRALTPWASATFVGARHMLVATAADAGALAHWLAMLPETELAMHGHFAASCAAEQEGCHATIELLVLEG